jgi:hypothetical protein
LTHKVLDDSVEDGSLEVKGLSSLTIAFLTSAQGTEVLRGLGNNILEL